MVKLFILTTAIALSSAFFMDQEGKFARQHPHPEPHPHPHPHPPHPDPRPEQVNLRPVIGILSLPIHPYESFNVTGNTYIASSYVKFVESGGARVVPIKVNESEDNIRELFTKLNGVLFTGGSADFFDENGLTDYAQRGCLLYNLTVEANEQGIHQPLWATCLGYELLHVCANNNERDTVGNFDGEPPYPHNLDIQEGARASRLLGKRYGERIAYYLKDKEVAYFSHEHGISPDIYEKYEALRDNYSILGTSHDHNNTEYVALVEHRKFPIYGSQFHPEKNVYEWGKLNITSIHSPEGVQLTNYFAQFFVSEARRNNKTFASEEELKPYLIYNYEPYFLDEYFEQIYHMD